MGVRDHYLDNPPMKPKAEIGEYVRSQEPESVPEIFADGITGAIIAFLNLVMA